MKLLANIHNTASFISSDEYKLESIPVPVTDRTIGMFVSECLSPKTFWQKFTNSLQAHFQSGSVRVSSITYHNQVGILMSLLVELQMTWPNPPKQTGLHGYMVTGTMQASTLPD